MTTERRRITAPETTHASASDLPLHIKYRPTKLRDVWGQEQVTRSLETLIKSGTHGHAYLFTGPAGTGKTTLARILAAEFGCGQNILEVDAASNSGIDSMREVTSTLRYQGFGAQPNKAIIIDECHGLSKQAWDSLLKSVEEPPPHVYFFFCTTEPGKVKDTIVSRCHAYNLKPINSGVLYKLVEKVADAEGIDLSEAALDVVVEAADGSARRALVGLSTARGCTSLKEVAAVLEQPLENREVIDLCRLIVNHKLTWEKAMTTIKALPEMNAESIRIVIANYLAACLMSARKPNEIEDLLDIATHFSKPFNATDKNLPLLLALGNVIYPPS